MTTELAERRKGRALALMLVAGALAAVAAVTSAIETRALHPDANAGLVLPGLEAEIANAQRITIVSAEASYHIEKTQRGWAMRDRDDFPVEASRLSQFTQGLEQLHYVRRMTSDPAKHERLGVTDPRQGGRGVLVQIEDGRTRALIVDVILGVEPSGATYVRRTGQSQTWLARGELPPLRDAAAWLDLSPVNLTPEQIARVEVSPPEGRGYVLARDGADQPWRLASPALAAISQVLLSNTAQRMAGLSPIDVRTAPAVQGAPRARVQVTTFDGVILAAELIESDGRVWLKLVARGATPEQEQPALAINDRAAAWAYALSLSEAGALAPPLSSLVASPPAQ